MPVKPGGLTDSEIEELEGNGWKRETTRYDVKGVDLGFAES